MSLFSDNLKYLRDSKNWSQQDVADKLLIKPARYSTYEYGRTEPPYEILVQFSTLYKVTIDLLLTANLRKIKPSDMMNFGKNRLLLPVMVGSDGEKIIEVVNQKAKAGYISGLADPEYIESLERISLPFLGPGIHRGFPVDGDSMPPHEDKSVIVGKFIEHLADVKLGKTYIFITKDNGMVYKRLEKNLKNAFVLQSDNDFYKSFELKVSEILEIWEFVCNIGKTDKKANPVPDESIEAVIRKMQKDMIEIKSKFISA